MDWRLWSARLQVCLEKCHHVSNIPHPDYHHVSERLRLEKFRTQARAPSTGNRVNYEPLWNILIMQKWYVAAHLLGRRCQQRLRTCNSVPCRYRHVSSYLSNIPGQHTWSSTFPAALLRPGEIFSSHTGSRATRHSSRVCRVGTSMGCVYRLLRV